MIAVIPNALIESLDSLKNGIKFLFAILIARLITCFAQIQVDHQAISRNGVIEGHWMARGVEGLHASRSFVAQDVIDVTGTFGDFRSRLEIQSGDCCGRVEGMRRGDAVSLACSKKRGSLVSIESERCTLMATGNKSATLERNSEYLNSRL